jgi:ADP-ribosylglycohydrolase
VTGAERDRYRGALLGLAAGDAVGTTLEFQPPGSFEPIDDMVGGGPFRLRPGEWTDDTSMALCLAESLAECGGFDAPDQMERYVRWWRDGYMSSNGRCFDIGNTTSAALSRFERTDEPYAGSGDPRAAGNGSIMRLAPVPLAFARHPREAIARSAESSRTTHGAPAAVDACRYLGGLISGAVAGVPKEELLAPRYAPVVGLWDAAPLHPQIDEIAAGSFKRKVPPAIVGSGHVVRSLEAALWALWTTDTFRDGCLRAANLGDDADTTAAVYGQLAGAIYGVDAIPPEWRERLALRATIELLADRLIALAEAP